MRGIGVLGVVAVFLNHSARGFDFKGHAAVATLDDFAITAKPTAVETGSAPNLHPLVEFATKNPLKEGKKRVIGGPFGLFSTGTNFVCQLFQKNKLPGGCNFYRQKHKPPEIVHDFMFHLAKDKRHRVWLHTLIEHLMRRDADKPMSTVPGEDGFTALKNLLSEQSTRDSICMQDFDGGLKNMMTLYTKYIEPSSWGGLHDMMGKEGKLCFADNIWQMCKSGYIVQVLQFLSASAAMPRAEWKTQTMWGDPAKAAECWSGKAKLAQRSGTHRCLQQVEEKTRQPFEHDMTPFRYLFLNTHHGALKEKLSWAQDVPQLPDFRTFDLADAWDYGREHSMLLISMVRNPLAWLVSLKRASYTMTCSYNDKLWVIKPCRMQFHIAAYARFESPVAVWNHYHRGYLKYFLPSHSLVIKYEDIVMDTEATLDRIMVAAGQPSVKDTSADGSFKQAEASAKDHGHSHGHDKALKKMQGKTYLLDLRPEQIVAACKELDEGLMAMYGYTDCKLINEKGFEEALKILKPYK
jgi:hypothetical protein